MGYSQVAKGFTKEDALLPQRYAKVSVVILGNKSY